MTPFGAQLHAQLQSMFAPKTQLYANSYGDTSGPGVERTIQSAAPAAPDPVAPLPAGGDPALGAPPASPITSAVIDLGGGSDDRYTKNGTVLDKGMGPNQDDPYGGMGPPALVPGTTPDHYSPEWIAAMEAGGMALPGGALPGTLETAGGGDAALKPQAPNLAPPQPQIQNAPQVDYPEMYAKQMARRQSYGQQAQEV